MLEEAGKRGRILKVLMVTIGSKGNRYYLSIKKIFFFVEIFYSQETFCDHYNELNHKTCLKVIV